MNLKTFKNLVKLTRARGPFGAATTVFRLAFPPKARNWPQCAELVRGRQGLEIGGPSSCFSRGFLPLYQEVGGLDNCNFSSETIWEGTLRAGRTFHFYKGKPPGIQFVCEGSNLGPIADASYDFILSHHALEHMANPIGALKDWRRVLKPGGHVILIVPHKAMTFDHRRPVTTLEHLILDFQQGTREDDTTHVEEILRLHDPLLDWGADARDQFEVRCRDNFRLRSMHHHVFTTGLVIQMFDYLGMQVLLAESHVESNALVVARISSQADNRELLGAQAEWRRLSPFPMDREVAGPVSSARPSAS